MGTLKTKLLAGIIAISVISCQKEITGTIDTTTSTTSTDKIKTYTEDVTSPSYGHVVTLYNVGYDSLGRFTSLVSTGSPDLKFYYSYRSSSLATMDMYESGALSIHEDFFLANSLLDSTFQYNDTNDSSTEKYLYNSAKQPITVKYYDYSKATGAVLSNTTKYTYDGNGNILTEADNNGSTVYTYYPTLYNNINLTPVFYGLNTKSNLIKTNVYTSGGTSTTANHTYTFDAKNRITSETASTPDSTIKVIKSYTYY